VHRGISSFNAVFFLMALSGCMKEGSSSSNGSLPQVEDRILTDSITLEISSIEANTFDTSYDLFAITSSASSRYRAEYIPLSEGLLSSIEPELAIIPDSMLGDSLQTHSDTVSVLEGTYRAAALEYAGVKESDSVFIYNFDRDALIARSVSELPLVALINVYGADLPLTTTDYQFGLDIQNIEERKKENYYELELVSIHHSNPFVIGEAKKIEWVEIDTSEYPIYIRKRIGDYKPDRCFRFDFEDMVYYSRTYLKNEKTRGFKMDVVRGDSSILELSAFSGEGSDPILSMLYGYGEFNQWTGNVLRGMPPVLHNFYVVGFGCTKVFFASEKKESRYITCDNRH